jgi:hypothetical protein
MLVLPGSLDSVLGINAQGALPKMLPGTVHEQWVRCGRDNCRCSGGQDRTQLHGPYYYRYWREDGRLRKEYIKRADLESVTAACNARLAHLQRQRDAIREIMQIVKDNRARWRMMNATMKRMLRGEI